MRSGQRPILSSRSAVSLFDDESVPLAERRSSTERVRLAVTATRAKLSPYGGSMELPANSKLLGALSDLYPQLVAVDAALGVACRCADVCWGDRDDPHRTNGTIFSPWVGADYAKGGVCVIGLNLRIGTGTGSYWKIERNIARDQHAALAAGRMRSKGSRWASATMRDAAAVLRHLDGRSPEPTTSPDKLARALERTARLQTVKCSPGSGRGTPLRSMALHCPRIYLSRELSILRPGVLLVYGSSAASAVRRIGKESKVERHAKRFRRMTIRFDDWTCTAFMLTHPAHAAWRSDHDLLRTSLQSRPIKPG